MLDVFRIVVVILIPLFLWTKAMIEWVDINNGVPGSDDHVLVKTNKGMIYSAYLDLEESDDQLFWKRTWLSNLNSAEIEDYLDKDEFITHWSWMPT